MTDGMKIAASVLGILGGALAITYVVSAMGGLLVLLNLGHAVTPGPFLLLLFWSTPMLAYGVVGIVGGVRAIRRPRSSGVILSAAGILGFVPVLAAVVFGAASSQEDAVTLLLISVPPVMYTAGGLLAIRADRHR